jgi:molybdenum cofactor synthesis domain-containing protein
MIDAGRGPSPQAAYTEWVAACTAAGWHADPVVEQVPVRDGLGRVTVSAARARWPSPRFACAAMDGIAVAARVTGSVMGGCAEGGQLLLPASEFSWVDTGDPLPAGTDTVVERERVDLQADGTALVAGPVTGGLNVRSIGEDFQSGELLIPAGRRLRSADISAAAAAGHVALPVARQPVVAIIPTGDEIRPVGSVLGPGEFTDTNSLLLAARASQAGAVPVVTDVQPDDPDILAAAVREAARSADLVLVIAGSSRGRGDFTAAVLAQVGGLAIDGVAVRPGHPVLLGHVKSGRSGPPASRHRRGASQSPARDHSRHRGSRLPAGRRGDLRTVRRAAARAAAGQPGPGPLAAVRPAQPRLVLPARCRGLGPGVTERRRRDGWPARWRPHRHARQRPWRGRDQPACPRGRVVAHPDRASAVRIRRVHPSAAHQHLTAAEAQGTRERRSISSPVSPPRQ